MLKLAIYLLVAFLVQTSDSPITIAGGQYMNKTFTEPAPEISVQLEPTSVIDTTDVKMKVEDTGRSILVKLFPTEMAKSSKVVGKITFVRKESKGTLFELNGLFLYRETYTAVTHKVIFALSDGGYAVLAIDGVKQGVPQAHTTTPEGG